MGQPADPIKALLQSLMEQHGSLLPPLELAEMLWLAPRLPSQESAIATRPNEKPGQISSNETGGSVSSHGAPLPESPQTPQDLPDLDPLSGNLPTFFPPAPPRSVQPPSAAGLLPDQALPLDADVQAMLPVRLQDVRLIAHPQPLQSALRALAGAEPHSVQPLPRRIIDEVATVEAYARTQRLWPHYTHPREPRLSLVLLVDGGLSMQVWQRLSGELLALLMRSAAFRDVRAVQLDPARPSAALGSLSGVGEEQVVLLLSDCSGRHWWHGGVMHALLRKLAWSNPLAILQVLPDWMWRRTALGIGHMVAVGNRQPLAANRLYQRQSLQPWEPPPPQGQGQFVVPLLSLDPASLAGWSRMVLGQAAEAVMGVSLPAIWPEIRITARTSEEPESPEQQARRRLRNFFQRCSGSAERLLRVMAAAPVLSLPVMRLLQEAMVPEGGPLTMAELLLSGLIQRVDDGRPEAAARLDRRLADRIQFDFEPGVRTTLLDTLPGPQTAEVVQRVSELIEARWDQCDDVPPFQAYLADPSLLSEGHPMASMAAFAKVTADIIERLPGPAYQRLAKKLRQGAGVAPPDPFPADQFRFEQIVVKPVTVQQIPGADELSPFTTAHYEDIPLREFPFQTAQLGAGKPRYSRGSSWGFWEQLHQERSTAEDKRQLHSSLLLEGHSDWVRALAVLPDGRLASGSDDGTIKIWVPETGAYDATLQGHSSWVYALVVLPDGRLATGSSDGTIKIWDPATGACAASFEGHSLFVNALAVLPDGGLASGSGDGTIKIWDPATGACTASFEGHSSPVNALAVLPDGRLASGSDDGTIEIWDPSTGSCAASVEGHFSSVKPLAVLSDGRLAFGSDDGTIKIWDPSTGDCVASFEGHSDWVTAVAVLPDGRLASGSGDGTIKIWDPATGACAASFEAHSSSVTALAVLPDGRLASGSGDATIRLWKVQKTTRSESVFLQMLHIPAGSFTMGSPKDEPERSEAEGPQHEVNLDDFFLSRTPITQAQWRAVAQWQPRDDEDPWPGELEPEPVKALSDSERFLGDERPVVNVSWHDAMKFCRRLSIRTGKHYTLPSESQWEYACRAGTTTPFHFGATITTELANYDGNYTYGDGPKGEYRQQSTDVASFPANAWGLYDMHGNVWEWCADPCHDNYNQVAEDGRPWLDENAAEDEERLLRGGSWFSLPGNCRSACRDWRHQGYRDDFRGFRVCCLPQDSASLHLNT